MRKPPKIKLNQTDQKELEKTARGKVVPARDVLRARIIIHAAKGLNNSLIADAVGVSTNTVGLWRRRFSKHGIHGLDDMSKSGRPLIYGREKIEEIIKKTIEEVPKDRTHWSTRAMAGAVGVGRTMVGNVWRAHQLKPHLSRTFKLSNDKHFTEKLHDVVGLYLNPPENALVWSVDEKSQIQALDRTQPGLPINKGRNGTMTHDYVRHGTCCLFAALNVLSGEVIACSEKRHRHQEYLKFLRQIEASTPSHLDLHLIADNYCTHKHPRVIKWLEKHPRFKMHFIPTSSSWLNMVERFFGKITVERIRRGVFTSVLDLIQAIHSYIENHNQNPKPFIWTKTADEIIRKLDPVYKLMNKTRY